MQKKIYDLARERQEEIQQAALPYVYGERIALEFYGLFLRKMEDDPKVMQCKPDQRAEIIRLSSKLENIE